MMGTYLSDLHRLFRCQKIVYLAEGPADRARALYAHKRLHGLWE